MCRNEKKRPLNWSLLFFCLFYILLGNISTTVDSIADNLKNFVKYVNVLNNSNANVYNEFIRLIKILTEDDI